LEGYIYYIFHNPIYLTFENENENRKSPQYFDYTDMYISILGILFFELGTFPETLSVLIKWIKGIISLIEKHKDNFKFEESDNTLIKYEILHPLKEIYFSLKLVGFWSYIYGDKILCEKIKEILKSQPIETKKQSSWGSEEGMTGIIGGQLVIIDSRGDKKRLHTSYYTFPEIFDKAESFND